MRMSDLLTSEVVTVGGERVGHVRDVRLVRDGPPLPGFGPSYRVHELIVGQGIPRSSPRARSRAHPQPLDPARHLRPSTPAGRAVVGGDLRR